MQVMDLRFIINTKNIWMDSKKGMRKSGPLGKYDGTYNEDFFFEGSNNKLDECNGDV